MVIKVTTIGLPGEKPGKDETKNGTDGIKKFLLKLKTLKNNFELNLENTK